MELIYLTQCIAVTLVLVWAVNWLIHNIILVLCRDLHPTALKQQSWIGPVRKKNETAVYRNIRVPIGLPLTNGLNLKCGYNFRRGNFGDIWSQSLLVGKGKNQICFTDGRIWSLSKINIVTLKLCSYYLKQKFEKIGIVTPVSTAEGFVCATAGFLSSVDGCIPQFLPSIPTNQMKLDALIIEFWEQIEDFKGSEKWYKAVIVCEECSSGNMDDVPANFISIYSLFNDANEVEALYEYVPNEADDDKELLNFTNPFFETMSFGQTCLTSSVSSFVKSFPVNHRLRSSDNLTIVVNSLECCLALQIWTNVFSVLLYGGSINFIDTDDLTNINPKTTLLVVAAKSKTVSSLLTANLRNSNRLALSWALALLSEGVFSTTARVSNRFANLRCVYIMNEVKDLETVTRLTSHQLNQLRALFGSRVIMVLYSPYTVMGSVAQTNMFDYRVFPKMVDSTFTCYGSMSSNVEGKLISIKEKPCLEASKRQGMLVIRGFAIGKPIEKEGLRNTEKISKHIHDSDIWTPILGVYGMWGNDGCFYEYK